MFAAEGARQPDASGTANLGHPDRARHTVLERYPVDVLLVEEPSSRGGEAGPTPTRPWENWLQRCPEPTRPDLVVVCADPDELVKDGGFHSKLWRSKVAALGYDPGFWYLRATDHGSTVRQDRMVMVLQKQASDRPAISHGPRPSEDGSTIRASTNMLKTHRIPWEAWARGGWDVLDESNWATQAAAPCSIIGTAQQDGKPVFCPTGSLPDGVGSWLRVEHRGGHRMRHLLTDELAKAKGYPAEWIPEGNKGKRLVETGTALHLWAAVGEAIQEAWAPDSTPEVATEPIPTVLLTSWMEKDELDDGDPSEWTWKAPDLSEGGEWYQARVASLEEAIAGRPDADLLRADGLEALRRHRTNYGEEGPQHLQILWWEFPSEHWTELRDGCPMNFLTEPEAKITPNNDMDGPATEVAAEFADELIRIGTLVGVPEGEQMLTNAPLFCLPKLGQEDQWRCIADMKSGGQNEHIGKDPVHLSRPEDILHRMYTGGYSAVVDASKFFYNFPTLPADRPYLGCIHPKTGEYLYYLGLPMGSASSPALTGKYGASLLRQIREQESVFQGTMQENGWRLHFEDGEFDPHKGVGLVCIGDDGLPAALMWIHVDDILIHAPTRSKCQQALDAFMEATLRVGLICQPCKSKPPAQIQKYCGFLYDTTGIPCLRVPQDKADRALASIQFLKSGARNERLSRLTFAVVIGLLQSLVDATPHRVGQTFLRRLYDRLHDGWASQPDLVGARFYYTVVELDEEEWLDLDWWERALRLGLRCYARSRLQDVLGVTWGDGSGTGTGGTVQLVPQGGGEMTIEAWMGIWEPQLFHNSANWKEARTLLHTLEREENATRLQGCTVFYFTDNQITYWIVNSGGSSSVGLHKLLRRIKFLEIKLDLRLEVVHVPGTHMIDQQTDGLSRGLAFANSRLRRSPQEEILRLFQPVPFTWELMSFVETVGCRPRGSRPLQHVESVSNWVFGDVAGRSTVWTPRPDWADQVITAVLNVWIEQPLDTEAYFVVPRIFQRRWGRKSKHIVEVSLTWAHEMPGPLETDIPVVVLHLPFHVRSLPLPSRLDPAPGPHGARWHSEQAEHVRGL